MNDNDYKSGAKKAMSISSAPVKISVLMPIYNQEKYIDKCLRSVCAQTLKDLEIIVINDGSTDRSMEIVNAIAETDDRIVIIDKTNSGYGDSVNRGLDRARGEYVGIVETDDFIAENMYETLYSLSRNGSIDLVKGNFYDYYADTDGSEKALVSHERDTVPENTPANVRFSPQILWGHPSVWSAIYKRSLLEENHIRFLEAKGGGWVDNPFFFDALFHAKEYVWTKTPLYYYRKTNANASSKTFPNPVLPFERMTDNLDVAEKNHFTDTETLRFLYARALMYMTGAKKECDYDRNFEKIDLHAKDLMQRCHSDIMDDGFSRKDRYLYYTNASPIKTMLLGSPKVLIYNWVPFDHPETLGSGVTIYCKNLIDTILKESPSTQVYFLSSGYRYDATRTDIYIRLSESTLGDRVRKFDLVNSPVPANQWLIHKNPTIAFENESLKSAVQSFIDQCGPFDVIHFNNLEGLSFDVLDLKKNYPNTKFIFSIHNYNTLCLTGFYYQRHNHCICRPDHTPEDCFACSRKSYSEHTPDILYRRGKTDIPKKERIPEDVWKKEMGFDRLYEDASPDQLITFAKIAVEKINKNCDHVLAVSKKVRDIAEANGFDKEKLSVSYIGTKVARGQIGHSVSPVENGLKIIFLGNKLDQEEKGYPFLLKALGKLEKKYAEKIDVVLTTRDTDTRIIYDTLKDFRSIKVYPGYTHKDLKKILAGCNLSVIPVLWEDNLPQIAIESVAYGVPVLASDAGGASELCTNDLFKFKHGDEVDFLQKLKYFVDRPETIEQYWTAHNGLVTLEDHWNDLNEHYYKIEDRTVTLSGKDLAMLLEENAFLKSNFSETTQRKSGSKRKKKILRFIRKIADVFLPKGSKRREFVKKIFKRY